MTDGLLYYLCTGAPQDILVYIAPQRLDPVVLEHLTHTCMYCINCFFIDSVVRLLFYVNMCTCHVYFTINSLTYLLTYLLTRDLVVRLRRLVGAYRFIAYFLSNVSILKIISISY